MNNRIRELAEQATSIKYGGERVFFGVREFFDKEKFAELIVRECTNFLKDTMDDHFAAEQLEVHFGVKE
jgi:hypothetical protein